MSVLLHFAIALAYVTVTAAVAVGLPQIVLGIDQITATLLAALGVLFGGLIHLAVVHAARGRRLTELSRRQAQLSKSFAAMRKAVADASPELLRVALSEAHEEVAAERKVMRLLNDQIGPDDVAADGATGDAILELGDELLEAHGAPPEPVTEEPERVEPRLNVGLDRDEFLRNVGRADVPMGAEPAPHTAAEHRDGPGDTDGTDIVSDLRRELIQPAIENDAVLDEIQEALRDGRVSVFLQPVVSLPTRKVAFYESFSRIRAADGSVVGPERYIPVAEKEGLVSAIDNNLLFRCIQLVRKTRQRNRDYRFFCNISPHTLRDRSFFPQFIEFMGENEDLAESLIFELSQDDLAAMDEEVELNLQALAAIGFSFSMDRVNRIDLNFENLARRQFRYVKIEANILHELMGEDDEAVELELLQARINRAGIDLVVEKIETEQQLVDFLDFPIAFGQGYLFGEPRLSKIAA
jgi:cyclic-di-GMP phosphodiesterase, flagellum assembly factor TipF